MGRPVAYFLTWSCYGAWLHGDPRGSVDAQHNELCTFGLRDDPQRLRGDVLRMNGVRMTLSDGARSIVDTTIRRHCEIRGWKLWAANVRTTHVHVVVDCMDTCKPEAAMEQFKAWATRKLREAGLVGKDQKVWTEHGSTRWVDTVESLAQAVDYVLNQQ